MSAKRPIRCAIYTRKSTEEGLEQEFNSLDAQREACAAYITSQKAEGWTALEARYDDGGFSGGTLERPALRRLLADMEAGRVDVVVVYKIDRLSRSLLDFTRLVELFDRKTVTFVSVTQSFNTTTSMGRLTLNVLLSFAQFEREVTGERIRDKFAASKKKGIWMGGNPPLGYDIGDRKLVVNPAEAETVLLIYRRYLELGCVRLLRDDLRAKGVVSKHWTSRTGVTRVGKPIERSALLAILNNRVYVGETMHKGQAYAGEHAAIVPRELFDAVQQKLTANRAGPNRKTQSPQDAPLAGLLFDETAAPMVPTYSVKSGTHRYRYYASRPTMIGERSKAAIHRIPAPAFEAFLANVLSRLQLVTSKNLDRECLSSIRRIEVKSASIVLRLDRAAALATWRERLPQLSGPDRDIVDAQRPLLATGETMVDDSEHLVIILPVRASFRGGRITIQYPANPLSSSAQPDMVLIKALARAHRWKQMLLDGDVPSIEALAVRIKQDRGHVGQIVNLAFLSPGLTRAILRGEQPPGLRLKHFLAADIPLAWKQQPAAIARLANGTNRVQEDTSH